MTIIRQLILIALYLFSANTIAGCYTQTGCASLGPDISSIQYINYGSQKFNTVSDVIKANAGLNNMILPANLSWSAPLAQSWVANQTNQISYDTKYFGLLALFLGEPINNPPPLTGSIYKKQFSSDAAKYVFELADDLDNKRISPIWFYDVRGMLDSVINAMLDANTQQSVQGQWQNIENEERAQASLDSRIAQAKFQMYYNLFHFNVFEIFFGYPNQFDTWNRNYPRFGKWAALNPETITYYEYNGIGSWKRTYNASGIPALKEKIGRCHSISSGEWRSEPPINNTEAKQRYDDRLACSDALSAAPKILEKYLEFHSYEMARYYISRYDGVVDRLEDRMTAYNQTTPGFDIALKELFESVKNIPPSSSKYYQEFISKFPIVKDYKSIALQYEKLIDRYKTDLSFTDDYNAVLVTRSKMKDEMEYLQNNYFDQRLLILDKTAYKVHVESYLKTLNELYEASDLATKRKNAIDHALNNPVELTDAEKISYATTLGYFDSDFSKFMKSPSVAQAGIRLQKELKADLQPILGELRTLRADFASKLGNSARIIAYKNAVRDRDQILSAKDSTTSKLIQRKYALENQLPLLGTLDLGVTQARNLPVVKVGKDVTFTVTIKNYGKSKATGIVLKDTIPAGVNLTACTNCKSACKRSNSVLTCSIPDITPGSQRTWNLTVRPMKSGTFKNSVFVNMPVGDKNFNNNSSAYVIIAK